VSQVSNTDLPDAKDYHLSIEVAAHTLSAVRAHFTTLFTGLALDAGVIHQLLIALDEAVQNIVRHGYRADELPGRLDITTRLAGNELIIELRDYAAPAELERIRPAPRDDGRHGGYGLHLIYATMDEVQYTHAPDGNGNLLIMRKHLG
jgi:sigma-B regulation protein RsbU (phosphoserine phosphatase)